MRLLVSSFLVLALAGCVNDGGQTGPKQGDLGGPCFANNTCNANLVCVLVSGAGVCQQPDATSDQGAPDSIAPSDAGDGSTPCTTQPSPPCPQDCKNQDADCCAQTGACVASGSSGCSGQTTWTCTARSDCPNGFCCIAGSEVQPTCPPTWMVNGGAACSANECTGAGSFYEVCTTNSECPSTHPTCTAVRIQGINAYVGLCM